MNNLAYQEAARTEMLDGKIVSMSPRPALNHNIVSGNIFNIFKNYLKGNSCIPFVDGIEIHLSEQDIVIPDCLIVCNRDILKKKWYLWFP